MLKFGEYARTNKGDIFIYANVVDENGNKLDYIMKLVNGGPIKYYLNKDENIVKHSKNIIDLIEVGDYVNGYPVRRIPNFNNELCNFDLNNMEWTPLKEIDVYYNILTKELYQANCYTVERKEEC